MRVLIFGGSFDPPHRGHAQLLSAAAARIRPDKIVIVPAHQAPLKDTPAAGGADRLALVRLGLVDTLPRRLRKICRIDAREVRAKRRVFTFETLEALAGDELHFVCGQDSAASFTKWRNASRLKSMATWWYGARPGSKGRPPSHFRKVPGNFLSISSTSIRFRLALDRDCSKELFPQVSALIDERRLYGKATLNTLRSNLSPGRYEHTLNVAELAEALARRHGADPAKARTAGLLHDAGRRYPPAILADYVMRRRLKIPLRATLIALDPMLLHAYVSEDLARREFGVRDRDILRAVRRHTLGDRNMSLLDKILYVADACSADRSHNSAADGRALAFTDLDAALLTCVREKIIHALSRGAWIHPLTLSLWNRLALS